MRPLLAAPPPSPSSSGRLNIERCPASNSAAMSTTEHVGQDAACHTLGKDDAAKGSLLARRPRTPATAFPSPARGPPPPPRRAFAPRHGRGSAAKTRACRTSRAPRRSRRDAGPEPGANSAERAPTTTRAAPVRSRSHWSNRSPGDSRLCSTATSSPNRARKRPTVCGVSEISGTSTIDAAAGLEHFLDSAQVDLGLARSGHAVDQDGAAPASQARRRWPTSASCWPAESVRVPRSRPLAHVRVAEPAPALDANHPERFEPLQRRVDTAEVGRQLGDPNRTSPTAPRAPLAASLRDAGGAKCAGRRRELAPTGRRRPRLRRLELPRAVRSLDRSRRSARRREQPEGLRERAQVGLGDPLGGGDGGVTEHRVLEHRRYRLEAVAVSLALRESRSPPPVDARTPPAPATPTATASANVGVEPRSRTARRGREWGCRR